MPKQRRTTKKLSRAAKSKGSRRPRIKLSRDERKMLAAIATALQGKAR